MSETVKIGACECCRGAVEGAEFGTLDARRLERPCCRGCWSFIERGWTVSQIRRKALAPPWYAGGATVPKETP